MMKSIKILGTAVLMGILGTFAQGQGMIVPVRPDLAVRGHWAVKYHHVNMTVRDQVASVSVDQEFFATGKQTVEVEYLVPVPPEAAIDSMTLVVNGREFPARLLGAEEARKIYEDIVRQKKDPALLEYAGFGLYRTSAFPLVPGKPAKVLVTYKQVCSKDADLVKVWYPLNTEKFSAAPIEEVKVRLDLKAPADITAVYSPSHDLNIKRQSPRHVIASWQEKNTLPATDFQVFYKASNEAIGATLLTHQVEVNEDGYFLLMVSPKPQERIGQVVAKDVVLVLDHSGSMSGEKMQQAKEAVRYVLKNLNRRDRFNVIAYSTEVDSFFDKLQPAARSTLQTAQELLDRLDARGGTQIEGALRTAFSLFDDSRRPKYVLFLTDGQPTIGVTEEPEILSRAREANQAGARLFAFGVGYDVNIRLLDKLALEHQGRSDYVKPKEVIEEKIAGLYKKIRNPVMTNLEVEVTGLRLRNVHPRNISDLFEGDQILMVGRFDAQDAGDLARGDGSAHTQLLVSGWYENRDVVFEYPVKINRSKQKRRYEFVPGLWAVRQVGYLLDQIQLHGQKKELVEEIVRLSREHGIITPYTSFLADERTNLADARGLRERAKSAVNSLEQIDGVAGQIHAENRQLLNEAQRAPQTLAPGGGKIVMGWDKDEAYEQGQQSAVSTVRQVGNLTLYKRGKLWLTADASKFDPAKNRDQIKVIERFSKEYFELIRANNTEENQALASQETSEELMITLRGQAYLVR